MCTKDNSAKTDRACHVGSLATLTFAFLLQLNMHFLDQNNTLSSQTLYFIFIGIFFAQLHVPVLHLGSGQSQISKDRCISMSCIAHNNEQGFLSLLFLIFSLGLPTRCIFAEDLAFISSTLFEWQFKLQVEMTSSALYFKVLALQPMMCWLITGMPSSSCTQGVPASKLLSYLMHILLLDKDCTAVMSSAFGLTVLMNWCQTFFMDLG